MGSREIARLKDVTAHSTEKSGKAGPRPWEIEQYIYKEPRDDQRSSHGDPRLEFALQSLSLHPDDFIPFDDDSDHGSGYPACGLGAMPDLHASTSFANELGTLAGKGAVPGVKVGEYNEVENKNFWKEHDQEYGRKKARDNWNYASRRYRAKTDDQYLSTKERNQERWKGTVDRLLNKHFND